MRAIRIRGSILSLSDWGCTHQFFPYWLRLFFCILLKISSFYSEFCPSVLLKYQLLPFLGFGRLYFSNINSFLFWGFVVCTSQISTPSFLGFGRLYFSNINSFLFGVWPSVLRKYQLLPFLGFGRLYFSNINSFLFGVWPFVLLKYQLLPFWLRLHADPLYLCAIIVCSIYHSLGPGCTRPKGAEIYSAITLIGPSVLCWRKGEKQLPQWPGHNECASYLGQGDLGHFCFIGPGCTRPYTNINKS